MRILLNPHADISYTVPAGEYHAECVAASQVDSTRYNAKGGPLRDGQEPQPDLAFTFRLMTITGEYPDGVLVGGRKPFGRYQRDAQAWLRAILDVEQLGTSRSHGLMSLDLDDCVGRESDVVIADAGYVSVVL
ncbi:MAG TPA: hypothetical protein VIK61_04915 [Acidimicrobiia bacterium]